MAPCGKVIMGDHREITRSREQGLLFLALVTRDVALQGTCHDTSVSSLRTCHHGTRHHRMCNHKRYRGRLRINTEHVTKLQRNVSPNTRYLIRENPLFKN